MELTDKQKRFCQEYVIDLNATQAAIRAGYEKDSARSTSSRLMEMDEITTQVQILQEAIAERLKISAEKVMQELAKLAFADIRDYFEPNGEIKNPARMDPDKTSAVETLRIVKTEWQGGCKTSIQLKLYSKQKALEKLGAHLGIFEKDYTPCGEEQIIVIGDDDDDDNDNNDNKPTEKEPV